MYKDILFPVDISEKDLHLKTVDMVVGYAKTFKARVHVITVVPDFGLGLVAQYFPEGTEEKMINEANDALHKFVSDNFPKEIEVQHIVTQGSIYRSILKAATDIDADLIVMQAHKPALEDIVVGPNAVKVVRGAKCSVLVVRKS